MAFLLLESAVRALLIAASTAAVLWALRIRTPAARHLAWAGVVCAMLVLPVWSLAGVHVPVRLLQAEHSTAVAAAPSETPRPDHRIETGEAAIPAVPAPSAARPFDWQGLIVAGYLIGAALLIVRLVIGTAQSARLRRSAISERGLATNTRLATPITIGWFAPMMILPSGWQRWPAGKLDAVLTHEREHIRRRDPLVQWLALLNRAIFWFHPLAWWLERHVAALAEEACDAAVIAAGHAPQAYADYLLDLAKSVTHEGRRIRTVGMAMPGTGLRSRLGKILDGISLPSVSRGRALATAALCLISSALFAAGTLDRVSPPAAVAPASFAARPVDPAPTAPTSPAINAQSDAKPQFDVVSVKPCTDVPRALIGRRGGLKTIDNTAHRLYLECISLEALADLAYTRNGDFALNDHIEDAVRGGPDWIRSDRFTIEATTAADTTAAVMMGPMLRALLEDRFQLRQHRDTVEIPMYALTVAKGGLKVKPMAPGDCEEGDPEKPVFTPGGKTPCGGMRGTSRGSVRIWDFGGISMSDLANALDADRRILDQTGVKGNFIIHLEYERDEKVVDGVNLFAALEQQLGLKLISTKGPHDVVVIDRAERPRPD